MGIFCCVACNSDISTPCTIISELLVQWLVIFHAILEQMARVLCFYYRPGGVCYYLLPGRPGYGGGGSAGCVLGGCGDPGWRGECPPATGLANTGSAGGWYCGGCGG